MIWHFRKYAFKVYCMLRLSAYFFLSSFGIPCLKKWDECILVSMEFQNLSVISIFIFTSWNHEI